MSGSKSSLPDAVNAADSPLAFTVHSLPDPAAARTKRSRVQMWLVLLVCAAPVLASYFSFYVLRLQGKPYGELITPPHDMPAQLALQDLQGGAVAPAALQGQWLLTVALDQPCAESCERLLFMQRQLREMLGKERDKVDKLLLLADTVQLSPAQLGALTQGVPVTILRLPAAALTAWLQPAAGHGLGEHLYLIDPQGRWMLRSPAQAEPTKVKKDLERLLKANAGWDRPGR